MNLIDYYPTMAADYDLLFVDTEFSRLPLPTELLADWSQRAEILSVGIAAAEQFALPNELYAVRSITPHLGAKCSDFVNNHVLPLINQAERGDTFSDPRALSRIITNFLSKRSKSSARPSLIAVDWPGDLRILASALPSQIACVSIEAIVNIDDRTIPGALRHHALHDARALRRAFLKRHGDPRN